MVTDTVPLNMPLAYKTSSSCHASMQPFFHRTHWSHRCQRRCCFLRHVTPT